MLNAVEQLAAALQGDDGVVEGRRRGIARDLSDFLQFVRHALLERGRKVLVLDRGERRQVVGQRAFGQKRIGHGRRGGFSRRTVTLSRAVRVNEDKAARKGNEARIFN